jgi:hypothetical protein
MLASPASTGRRSSPGSRSTAIWSGAGRALPAVRNDQHLVVVPEGGDFVTAALDLLADRPRRERLRANANGLLHQHYRWSEVGRVWSDALEVARPTAGVGMGSASRTRSADDG